MAPDRETWETALSHLHPVVRDRLVQSRSAPSAPVTAETIAAFRPIYAMLFTDRTIAPGVTVADIGIADVRARLYRPAIAGPLPLHVYCHGGGFVVGSALSGELDGTLSRRAARAGCIVASIEYGLAPEHPFPQGVEQCFRALAALCADAEALGIDPRAVSVGGASSGANFAAVLTLIAREHGGPALGFQLLEIAGLDMTKASHAWRHPEPGHDTTRERDLELSAFYLGDIAQRAHPYASPLFAADLSRLPPAYIMNAEHDPRRDECETYAQRLRDHDVAATTRTLAGHTHGSLWLDWPGAAEWQAEADAMLAAANAALLAGKTIFTA